MAVIRCMLYSARWELRSTQTKSRNSCHLQSLSRLLYTVLPLGQQFNQLHPCLLCICCWRPVVEGGSRMFLLSDQISRSVVSDSLRPHESQHARPPCPSPAPGVHWDSRPLSQWCHPAISSSVVPFSSCSQSLPAVFFAIPSCNSVHTLTGFSKCKYPKTFGQTSKDCKN